MVDKPERIFPPTVKPTALKIFSHWIALPSSLTGGGGVYRIHPRKCRPLNLQEGREKEGEYERSEWEIRRPSACAGRARKNISRKAENWNMSCGRNSLFFFFFSFFFFERDTGDPLCDIGDCRHFAVTLPSPFRSLFFSIFIIFVFIHERMWRKSLYYTRKSLSICHNFPYLVTETM